MTATATGDGDALVLYGSDFNYRAERTSFRGGIAHFAIMPPDDHDDFKVSVMLGSLSPGQAATTKVVVRPQKHLLHLRVTSTKSTYQRGETVRFSVHVTDWRGTGEAASVLASATKATAATIAVALARPNAAYDALYTPQSPNGDYVVSLHSPGSPRISYLYPTASPSPTLSPLLPPQSAPTPQPTPAAQSSALEAQTIFWRNDLSTDAAGDAVVSIPLRQTASPGLYLFHVLALTKDAKVGEAYAWIRAR